MCLIGIEAQLKTAVTLRKHKDPLMVYTNTSGTLFLTKVSRKSFDFILIKKKENKLINIPIYQEEIYWLRLIKLVDFFG